MHEKIPFTPFELHAEYEPAGDQPEAIAKLVAGFKEGLRRQTLLGATGTGKTFTMANIIYQLQKPTLVLSHNKTLAAQLATEFKYFFPKNAVHYFISYFDYYQPESYLPAQDLYIEKEATINQEIEMYRLSTLASLLTRTDVIVVASVSALYGLGKREFFREYSLILRVGESYDFSALKKRLIKMQYKPVASKIEQGMFDFVGERVDIYASTEKVLYRLHFDDEKLQYIEKKNALTLQDMGCVDHVVLWPATQFLQNTEDDFEDILARIKAEKDFRVKEFEQQGNLIAAQRIEKRVSYDLRMIRETGFVNGIENYSPYFDRRAPGEPPNTLFDYFPDDFLLIIDESHMTIPQLIAMPAGDRSRKINLIDHGFRLPSAIDHRPLRFDEFADIVGRPLDVELPGTRSNKASKKGKESYDFSYKNLFDILIEEVKDANLISNIDKKTFLEQQQFIYTKSKADRFRGSFWQGDKEKARSRNIQTLFVSATPAPYELFISQQHVEQIIRPTGLLDPVTYVYPKSGDYNLLLSSLESLLKKKPWLKKMVE